MRARHTSQHRTGTFTQFNGGHGGRGVQPQKPRSVPRPRPLPKPGTRR
ncbi:MULTISPECIES: hypothetical protein [unclassified Streptomyces]|nr:hypothetical protein OIE54_02575 [Streptomyces sp. NBC_01794]